MEHDYGAGSIARYFDGTPFDPVEELAEEKISELVPGYMITFSLWAWGGGSASTSRVRPPLFIK